MKSLSLTFTIILFCISCSSQKRNEASFDTKNRNYIIHNEFKTYFDKCGVNGSIVILDKNNQNWIVSDSSSIKTESLPASTFKIINLLIALETKTIKDENKIVKWPGKTDTLKYGYRPEIYHDMTVKEAFEVSAGWVFIELAKKIGKEKYKAYLKACAYGNLDLTVNDDDFWNFGNFAISPINQVEFIRNLHEGRLPFSKRNIEIVKRVLITEQSDEYTIRAKTGWTRANNTNTGWWVGYLEANNNTYYFATRLLQDRNKNRGDFGSCRKEITKKIFSDLGFINKDSAGSDKDNALFKSIDHVPIVVNDLNKIKDIFQNKLHFTIKDGKVHEGIKNCFVKFQDGTYLEFIEPIDGTYSIGKHYQNFLKTRQGGTYLAISIDKTELAKNLLNEKNIAFNADSNKIWQTIEPENFDLFFIKYADSNWKESSKNTTHRNTANSLKATYILSKNLVEEEKKYQSLGFKESQKGDFLNTSYKHYKIGQSSLYLMENNKSRQLNQLLETNKLQGICGFEIKVNSLETFNNQVGKIGNAIFEKSKTTVYFKDYNFFLIISE